MTNSILKKETKIPIQIILLIFRQRIGHTTLPQMKIHCLFFSFYFLYDTFICKSTFWKTFRVIFFFFLHESFEMDTFYLIPGPTNNKTKYYYLPNGKWYCTKNAIQRIFNFGQTTAATKKNRNQKYILKVMSQHGFEVG